MISAKTDIGKNRKENQDNYRAGCLKNGMVWAVVCDGMGGAQGGAIASSIAAAIFEAELPSEMSIEMTEKEIFKLLENSAKLANDKIYSIASQNDEMLGMGTTVVAAIIKENSIYIIHAGDSRAYCFEKGELTQLTIDHSVVQQLVENGELTKEQADSHPKKNLITRAIGVDSVLQLDYKKKVLAEGEILVLCTDGLSNVVNDEEIANIITENEFFSITHNLIDAALLAGGQDNITALLVKFENKEV